VLVELAVEEESVAAWPRRLLLLLLLVVVVVVPSSERWGDEHARGQVVGVGEVGAVESKHYFHKHDLSVGEDQTKGGGGSQRCGYETQNIATVVWAAGRADDGKNDQIDGSLTAVAAAEVMGKNCDSH